MKNPFFSAVIPTHNRSKMACEAVVSALKQSFLDFEVIVIDDGSTDDTQSELEKFKHQIHYFKQPNGGVSSARNLGIAKSKGLYICYLDSDDLWESDYLENIYRHIQNNNKPDVILTNFKRFDLRSEQYSPVTNTQIFPQVKKIFEHISDNFYQAEKLESLECILSGYPVFPSALTIKRSVHDDIRWDTAILKSEDFNIACKLAFYTKLSYIDVAKVIVRMHDSNKSYDSDFKERVHTATMMAVKNLYANSDKQRKIVDKYIARRMLLLGHQKMNRGKVIAALSHYFTAVQYPQTWRHILQKLTRKNGH